MKDENKTKTQLINELRKMRRKIAELEALKNKHKQAEEELRESEEKYRVLVESTEDHIYLIDKNCKYLFMNEKHLSRLGLKKGQIIGKPYGAFHTPQETEDFAKKVKQVLETNKSLSYEYSSVRDDKYYIRTLSPVKDPESGEITAVTVISKNITRYKQAEERIKYLSFHDALTGLYNRAYFEEEIKRLNTPRKYPIGVIMVDIDNLKFVNDNFGHAKGDELLKRLANILSSIFRKEDVVARIGGDEFVIVLPNVNEETVQSLCKRVDDACEESNQKSELKLSVSLGYAIQYGQYKNMEEVLKKADQHMYRNKLVGDTVAQKHLIDSFKLMLAKRDLYTPEHYEQKQFFAISLSKNMNLPPDKIKDIRLLAVLHDIGKIGIADLILHKPGKLSSEEWEVMKTHCEIGYTIANVIPELTPIAEDILCHHERWDGKGYPKGLKGEEIPLLARIVAIVDAYSAMLSDRPYRKAMSKQEALEEIKKGAGGQFDPQLVELFLEIVGKNS